MPLELEVTSPPAATSAARSASRKRGEVGDGLLHHPSRLDDLGEEHPSGTEQVADEVHPVHQRPFDHRHRRLQSHTRLLDIFLDELGDAIDQRVFEPLVDVPVAPFLARPFPLVRLAVLVSGGGHEQVLCGVGTACQHDVLAEVAQLAVDLLVHRELSGVDDAKPHAVGDGVVQEHRVHGFADLVVASEGERQIRHATRHVGCRDSGDEVLPSLR